MAKVLVLVFPDQIEDDVIEKLVDECREESFTPWIGTDYVFQSYLDGRTVTAAVFLDKIIKETSGSHVTKVWRDRAMVFGDFYEKEK